ncbi:MAG: 50S ribosomal protein L35 [SAR202 cluster bacterium]|nr:50S ribosomal protein L35 [SAR202 cluster bacterium]
MPKIKTHKGAARRFHVTGSGKVVRTKGPKSHLRRNKAKRVKRLFGGKVETAPVFAKKIKPFLPK